MRYAPVAPIGILERLWELLPFEKFNYHLWLAQDILSEPKRYAALSRAIGGSRESHIIVDNGVVELGEALPHQQLVEAAAIANANVLVLPDVIDDGPKTLKLASAAIIYFRYNAPWLKLLGMIQGKDRHELHIAISALTKLGVDWLGFPKWWQERGRGERAPLLREWSEHLTVPIHAFGMTNDLADDARSAYESAGIDSAMPIWLGLEGLALPAYPPSGLDYGRRPLNYSQAKMSQEQEKLVVANINRVYDWLNKARDAEV